MQMFLFGCLGIWSLDLILSLNVKSCLDGQRDRIALYESVTNILLQSIFGIPPEYLYIAYSIAVKNDKKMQYYNIPRFSVNQRMHAYEQSKYREGTEMPDVGFSIPPPVRWCMHESTVGGDKIGRRQQQLG
jgi:hypothetical protein